MLWNLGKSFNTKAPISFYLSVRTCLPYTCFFSIIKASAVISAKVNYTTPTSVCVLQQVIQYVWQPLIRIQEELVSSTNSTVAKLLIRGIHPFNKCIVYYLPSLRLQLYLPLIVE